MKHLLHFLLLVALLPTICWAKPGWEEKVPENLRSWIPWVTKDLDIKNCPFDSRNIDIQQCLWESSLALNLNNTGGDFIFDLIVDEASSVTLPGGYELWPQNIQVNQMPVAIQASGNQPKVLLTPGEYKITGNFTWKNLPEKFYIPPAVALLKVKVNGEDQLFPNLQDSVLTLNEQISPEVPSADVNTLTLKVFRRIEDNLPARADTLVRLEISGKPREIKLNPIALPNFTITDIQSSLPIGVDQKGNITVQARAGSYEIRTVSFSSQPLSELTYKTAADWSPYELWTFTSIPSIRVIDLEGATAVDPTQYDIPYEWQNNLGNNQQSLNSYRVDPEQVIKVVEKQRGTTKQASDSLELQRTIKLNFDGKSYSVFDQLNGTIASDKHLMIDNQYQLGNVQINGVDQLISKIKTSGEQTGVEVRPGQISLIASGQITTNTGSKFLFPGWKTNINSLATILHLPPGWQLLHVWGAEYVYGSWFSKWSLLDIFFVMLTVVAIFKVYNWKMALLALVALILFEKHLFSISWVILLATGLTALIKYVQHEKFNKFCARFKTVLIGITALCVLMSVFTDIKYSVHPQLQYLNLQSSADQYQNNTYSNAVSAPAVGAAAPSEEYAVSDEKMRYEDSARGLGSMLSRDGSGGNYGKKEALMEAKAKVLNQYITNVDQATQTGRGNSNWSSYRNYSFGWRTPILQDQSVSVCLLSPFWNMILAFVRAGLILLLLAKFITGTFSMKLPKSAIACLFLSFFLTNGKVQAEDPIPDPQILSELGAYAKQNILEKPECFPNCTSITDFQISLDDQKFTMNFEIHSLDKTFFALPFKRSDLNIQEILLNNSNQKIRVKAAGDSLLVALDTGINKLRLAGQLSERETINIGFPEVPYHGSYETKDWLVSGIDANGKVQSVITLSKKTKSIIPTQSKEEFNKPKPLTLAQQFHVSRTLDLAYDSTITTTITRLSPANSSYELSYPLYSKESITTPGAEVKNGLLTVSFQPGETSKTYQSVITIDQELTLKANENNNLNEVWYLQATNLWHFEYSGTPRIYLNQEVPEWHPRPGETLVLQLEKPLGIVGTTKTIESLNIDARLGKELQTYKMQLTLKTSKGEVHPIKLPADSEIVAVKVNQLPQSFKPDIPSLNLNLSPGKQEIEVEWREKKELPSKFQIGAVELNAPIANLNIQYQIPGTLWVLAAGGTQYGPAVLFWGYLPIVILLAVALSRVKILPLKLYQWVLLLLGLSQVDLYSNIVVILWFAFFAYREKTTLPRSSWRFVILQIFLVFWSFSAFQALYKAIQTGLLGSPRMMIAGNSSNSFFLKWYQDLADNLVTSPWFLAIDIWCYRIMMLAWALWLASSIIRWTKWGFGSFTKDGAWYRKKEKVTTSDTNPAEVVS